MIFILLAIIILVVSFVIAFVSLVREQSKFEREIDFQEEEETEHTPQGKIQAHLQEKEPQPDVVPGIQSYVTSGELLNKPTREIPQDLKGSYRASDAEELFPWLSAQQQEPDLPQDLKAKRMIDEIKQEIAKKVEENQFKQSQDETEYASEERLRGEFSLAEHREE
ncbi:hypothetical protein A3C32_02250 [Candidatus Daviesbacteria bacterium RIFCSPHIGHO2_02_FULL_41_14]|uniref:Uncharacterized protein n=1 Tax=Candidatus Curtissbacteria bacterium RIFCSPLOWO2_01_FULL_42_26 TaxID=1797729 RepID=A0A1F5HXG1_9BACT|nr:MAG: hypothetical protein A3A60_00775 [Candidatus Curtissbacteria bacterium RIFCSPLOWO2_01_FULL_42_26]OGE34063.1 MAG: hypothetical protein A3C32_02250 [Candidatus Daviesbacteria bacterium RIFCSPHIGHO2_02_FULL_41_14]